MLDPSAQEFLAIALVAATIAAFALRWAKNRRSASRGCGGSCACPSKPGK
ncbi:MAG: hypothetical protein ACKO2G_10280 [Verrucomicrobiales bacterium]